MHGGMVQDVFTDDPHQQIVTIDWDDIDEDEADSVVVNGMRAWVCERDNVALTEMKGTDCGNAIYLAKRKGIINR